jgi:methylated-DNA-protein-cysteine methyltransferase-like protein
MPSSEADHVRRLYRAIHTVVRRIPRGCVATYGQVAELAGIPGGARVAGAAMKTSTPADGLPWQRVIAKAGRTRGRIAIHDPVGAAAQRQLLEDEGVFGRRARGCVDARRPTAGCRLERSRARAARPRRRPRSGSKPELRHHAVDVELRGVIADAEAIRDQLVREPSAGAARPGARAR